MSKQYVLVNEKGEYMKNYEISAFRSRVVKVNNPEEAFKFHLLEAARKVGKDILDATHVFYGPEPYPYFNVTIQGGEPGETGAGGNVIIKGVDEKQVGDAIYNVLRSQETTETEKKEQWEEMKTLEEVWEHFYVEKKISILEYCEISKAKPSLQRKILKTFKK